MLKKRDYHSSVKTRQFTVIELEIQSVYSTYHVTLYFTVFQTVLFLAQWVCQKTHSYVLVLSKCL